MSGTVDIARDPLVWRTAHYVMRPLGPEDTPEILALFGDPAVVEFMDIDPLANLDEAREVVDWARNRRAMGDGVRWSIRPAEDGPLIGTCGFNTLETDRGRRGEIAYDLARAHWGRGVMAEVLPPLIEFGFQDLALHRLEAFVTVGNDRSARLLERQGFVCEGVRREHAFWKGAYWDQLVFSRLARTTMPAGRQEVEAGERSDGVTLSHLTPDDATRVLDLYRAAAAGPGGLARTPQEMDLAHVSGFLTKAAMSGVTLGAWSPEGELCAEIHAARMGPAQFAHVLSDLTVAVRPSWQGRGLGSYLFRALFAEARRLTPRIERIELAAREGNADAIRLYERLGFVRDGRLEGRVRLPDGATEADITMGFRLTHD